MTPEQFLNFKNLLGKSESSGDYNIDLGQYWGKYQFGNSRRIDIARALGIKNPTRSEFIPELQEKFFKKHVELYENELSQKFSSKIGIPITGKRNGTTAPINIFGLIAGAHLGGATNLKKLLMNNIDTNDDYYNKSGILIKGNYISDYVAYFSLRMTLPFDVKKKKPVK